MYECIKSFPAIDENTLEQRAVKFIVDGRLAGYPVQVLVTVWKILFCAEVEQGFENNKILERTEWLVAYVNLIRSKDFDRTDISATIAVQTIITRELHQRDITEQFLEEKVTSVDDFEWQKHLRFYWVAPDEMFTQQHYSSDYFHKTLSVRQLSTQYWYGYEYIGAAERLVITPTIERCWMALSQSLNWRQGITLAGPSGTGKTHVIRDFAREIAIMCVTFMCSHQSEQRSLARLLRGVAQEGCLVCFDSINRAKANVLSVLAHLFSKIHNALISGVDSFELDESVIPIKHSLIAAATQNPLLPASIIATATLPDSLRANFRSVSLFVPELIPAMQSLLIAEGFIFFSKLKKNLKSISGTYISPGSGCVGKTRSVGYPYVIFGCH